MALSVKLGEYGVFGLFDRGHLAFDINLLLKEMFVVMLDSHFLLNSLELNLGFFSESQDLLAL